MHVNNNEHLSSVREPYLKSLAQKTGMAYTHLTDAPDFIEALRTHATPHPVNTNVSRGPIAAALGLICLGCVYIVVPLISWLRRQNWWQRRQLVVPVAAR